MSNLSEKPKIALISLGCPKNLVNSEEMAALLEQAGYAFTDDPAEADAAVTKVEEDALLRAAAPGEKGRVHHLPAEAQLGVALDGHHKLVEKRCGVGKLLAEVGEEDTHASKELVDGDPGP